MNVQSVKNANKLIALINLIYFQVGLLMSIMSALIPSIIDSYKLSYRLASMLPFAFYIAFGFLCIPAGMVNEKHNSKTVLIFSFLLALSGTLLFAIFPNYYASIGSLFIIGSSLAIIQVSVVPLLRNACGAENLAFHSSLNQLCYGAGAFLSPHIYSYLTVGLLQQSHANSFFFKLLRNLVPLNYEWISAYWLITILLFTTVLLITMIKFPMKKLVEKENGFGIYLNFFKSKYVIFYFIALMVYASCEQGIAIWMSKFFQEYHGFDPQTNGANILSWYWILLSLGCLLGMVLLKIFDSRRVLAFLSVLALISFSVGLYSNSEIAKWSFPLVGIFESVMWPIILSLALNSVNEHHEALTGFLYTASIGGALGPFIIGALSDVFGLQFSLNFIYFPLLFILSVAFWAKPLITNKTIN